MTPTPNKPGATPGDGYADPFDLLKQGGSWLGAARNWLKWNKPKGSRVTWGSNDELGSFTVREVEELAAYVAAAVMNTPARSAEDPVATLAADRDYHRALAETAEVTAREARTRCEQVMADNEGLRAQLATLTAQRDALAAEVASLREDIREMNEDRLLNDRTEALAAEVEGLKGECAGPCGLTTEGHHVTTDELARVDVLAAAGAQWAGGAPPEWQAVIGEVLKTKAMLGKVRALADARLDYIDQVKAALELDVLSDSADVFERVKDLRLAEADADHWRERHRGQRSELVRLRDEVDILRRLERAVFCGDALGCSPKVPPILDEYLAWSHEHPEAFASTAARPAASTPRVKRNLSTPEHRAYWADVERTAAKVDTWTAWKRAGINVAQSRDEARTADAPPAPVSPAGCQAVEPGGHGPCDTCNGTGTITVGHAAPSGRFGFSTITEPCPNCQPPGLGILASPPSTPLAAPGGERVAQCATCGGAGEVRIRDTRGNPTGGMTVPCAECRGKRDMKPENIPPATIPLAELLAALGLLSGDGTSALQRVRDDARTVADLPAWTEEIQRGARQWVEMEVVTVERRALARVADQLAVLKAHFTRELDAANYQMGGSDKVAATGALTRALAAVFPDAWPVGGKG